MTEVVLTERIIDLANNESVVKNLLIRCSDCKHFKTTLTEHCDLHRHLCKPYDYCSWAERKEES